MSVVVCGETSALGDVENQVGDSGKVGGYLDHGLNRGRGCGRVLVFPVSGEVIHILSVLGVRDSRKNFLGPAVHKHSKPVRGNGAAWR